MDSNSSQACSPLPASTLLRPGPGIAFPLLSHLLADACQLSPARVSTALTVAANDVTDTRWASSNYGSCVDLYSPGVNILSAMDTSNTATITATGTSMATPIVSGVAALYLQDNPTASAAEVRPAPWLCPGGCGLQGAAWQHMPGLDSALVLVPQGTPPGGVQASLPLQDLLYFLLCSMFDQAHLVCVPV